MRASILVTATLFAGALAACSKPAPDPSDRTGDSAAAPAAPGAEAQVVSALEAGRDPSLNLPKPPAVRVAQRSAPTPLPQAKTPAAEAPVAHVHADAIAEPVPAMSVAPVAAAPLSVNLAFLPGAPAPAAGQAAEAGDAGARRAFPDRGPAIIIRGGSGRPDDDCDLHNGLRPRGGVGIAINSLAPSTRPYRTGGHGSGMFPAGTRIR